MYQPNYFPYDIKTTHSFPLHFNKNTANIDVHIFYIFTLAEYKIEDENCSF